MKLNLALNIDRILKLLVLQRLRWLGFCLSALAVVSLVVTLQIHHVSHDPELVARAYVVAPNIVAIRIRPNPVIYAQQQSYQTIGLDQQRALGKNTWLIRGGQYLGTLIGTSRTTIYPFDRYRLPHFNPSQFDLAAHYQVQSKDDLSYDAPLQPIAVYRKSKPIDVAEFAHGKRRWPLQHTVFLKLPTALVIGKSYQIYFSNWDQQNIALTAFQYDPKHTLSEAVHISQVGFRPDDPVKIGFLSTWMGTGGSLDYPDHLSFSLVDDRTDQIVFSGQSSLRHRKDDVEDPRGRTYTLADVHQLDFSPFSQPGQYRLCVEGIGCSSAFAIADTVWQDAFYVAVRGFYHQRSGIALGPPYTTFRRPRAFHPDDGVKVYQSTTSLMDTGNGLNAQGTDPGNFANLVKGKTDELVPNAWGGYFDAGDWDRRIQHLDAARMLLELLELFPDQLDTLSLNLPESQNTLPDILDEALWGLDFFRRLQTPEGGIRGGIESDTHPKRGEASWQDSSMVLAYAPGVWSSYVYAGVAAQAARVLQTSAPGAAEVYRQSALAAMAFAEDRVAILETRLPKAQVRIQGDRALAALELYRLTQKNHWHQVFLAARDNVLTHPDLIGRARKPLEHIAFLYSRLDANQVNTNLQAHLRSEFLAQAEQLAQLTANTAFGWTKFHPMAPVGWGNGLGAPQVTTLLRAYTLTQKSAYLEAALMGCQFAAGANPDNMTFTTGLGHRSPQHPLILDQRVTGQPPPPGITVYGPMDTVDYGDYWMFEALDSVTTPPARQWPTVETYFDVFTIPAVNEFTIAQSMTATAYAWGYLSSR